MDWKTDNTMFIKRVWIVFSLLSILLWQTRSVRVGNGKWLAMIDRYQHRMGGRSCLADPKGSYSQRIAAQTLQYGVFWGITNTILGSFLFMSTGPRDKYGWRRGGIESNGWSGSDGLSAGMFGALMGRFERGGW